MYVQRYTPGTSPALARPVVVVVVCVCTRGTCTLYTPVKLSRNFSLYHSSSGAFLAKLYRSSLYHISPPPHHLAQHAWTHPFLFVCELFSLEQFQKFHFVWMLSYFKKVSFHSISSSLALSNIPEGAWRNSLLVLENPCSYHRPNFQGMYHKHCPSACYPMWPKESIASVVTWRTWWWPQKCLKVRSLVKHPRHTLI